MDFRENGRHGGMQRRGQRERMDKGHRKNLAVFPCTHFSGSHGEASYSIAVLSLHAPLSLGLAGRARGEAMYTFLTCTSKAPSTPLWPAG